jgi:uncharacterized protein (DUF342 family)
METFTPNEQENMNEPSDEIFGDVEFTSEQLEDLKKAELELAATKENVKNLTLLIEELDRIKADRETRQQDQIYPFELPEINLPN